MGLPPLDRPRGTAPGDPVLLSAGDEPVGAARGALDAMRLRREVFRAQGRVHGGCALGLLDCSGRRVHLREQVRGGGLTRLADVPHGPGPLRVAFLAIARLRIIG